MGIPTEVINARQSLITRMLVKRFLGLVMSAYGYRWAPGLIAVGVLELWVAYKLLSALADSRKR